MKTPVGSSLSDFAESRMKWIEDHYIATTENSEPMLCRECGTAIEVIGARMSIHDARFAGMCAGPGAVVVVAIPWCPKCETKPEDHGCFHEFPTVKNNPHTS